MQGTRPYIPIREKSTKVTALVQQLRSDLNDVRLTNTIVVNILNELKVHGRDPQGAEAIYSDEGLATVCKYAFGHRIDAISQEALRIIANALLLQPKFRDTLASLGHATNLVDLYRHPDDDYEFLAGRILFLLTYGTQTDFSNLVQSHGLAEALFSHLQRHSMENPGVGTGSNQLTMMAMGETLKLVFNLANALPMEIKSLSKTVQPICTILATTEIPPAPFDPPVNTLVNALAMLEFTKNGETDAEPTTSLYQSVLPKVLEILRCAVEQYKPLVLDTAGIPLLTVLRKLYEVSSSSMKTTMRKVLLPDDSERDLPLGQSSSLASKLLRLTSSPGLSNLPESISALLFELSDKDASTFVKDIGYGYAAGYLMTHKIPIPEGVTQSQPDKGLGNIAINPITGQRLDKESNPPEIEMTDEEKEREAERLFVLFERLKATGVVDVKNPVEQARDEGRFEELDGTDSDS